MLIWEKITFDLRCGTDFQEGRAFLVNIDFFVALHDYDVAVRIDVYHFHIVFAGVLLSLLAVIRLDEENLHVLIFVAGPNSELRGGLVLRILRRRGAHFKLERSPRQKRRFDLELVSRDSRSRDGRDVKRVLNVYELVLLVLPAVQRGFSAGFRLVLDERTG